MTEVLFVWRPWILGLAVSWRITEAWVRGFKWPRVGGLLTYGSVDHREFSSWKMDLATRILPGFKIPRAARDVLFV